MKEINLANNKAIALVSDCDYDRLIQFKWSFSGGYANRTCVENGCCKTISMHREITNCPTGMEVDHIDENKLNNQMDNLRIVTKQENIKAYYSKRRKCS